MNGKVCEYRIVRSKKYYPSDDNSVAGYDERYSIQEVYYDDDGKPMAQTVDLTVSGDTIPELRKQLQTMMWCLDKDIVDEVYPETEKIGKDGHGNNLYIYESPDGGETIYRREASKYRPEKLER